MMLMGIYHFMKQICCTFHRSLFICRANALAVASVHPSLKVCLGVHPCQVSARLNSLESSQAIPAGLELFQSVEKLIRTNLSSIVGLGECGLDFLPHNAKDETYKQVYKLTNFLRFHCCH
jgi:Tat protein secretion system quality control protein TatD with DNase activity